MEKRLETAKFREINEQRQLQILQSAWSCMTSEVAEDKKKRGQKAANALALREPGEIDLFARCLQALKAAARFPPNRRKAEIFQVVISNAKLPQKVGVELVKMVGSLNANPTLDHAISVCSATPPSLAKIDWRIKVVLADSFSERVLVPSVELKLTLSNRQVHTIELSRAKFALLRFEVARLMKDMIALETRYSS